ncbi:hypothetical protein CLU85_1676 [Acidovorax sp. 69]|nr:hypothetical protein CLU85_1676 [Acidovorax sp. 69]
MWAATRRRGANSAEKNATTQSARWLPGVSATGHARCPKHSTSRRQRAKKSPDLTVGAIFAKNRFCNQFRACSNLLGCGSAGSGGGSSVSSSLGSVSGWSRSVSSRCHGRWSSSVGGGRSGWLGSRRWCCGRSFHGSWCWSGLFLLATSGECSSSDQGGQNEGVLHFDFPIWTDRILKSHGVRLPEAHGTHWHNALGEHLLGAAADYIGI